jgi:ring-1,2-phenylacetyl-CoA epoxidase subunit PaaC
MGIKIQSKEAQFIIRLADTEIILGQRLTEMCSRGPFLEEDIAISNLALDLFGRGEELLKIVSNIEGNTYSADDYAYRRNEREYYNLKLVEQPNEDFAWVMAKQFLHDVYVKEVFTQLLNSSNVELKGLSEKVLKEITYSLEHSRNWMFRLGIGTEESNTRLQSSIDHMWKYMQEIFAFDDIDNEFLTDTAAITETWKTEISRVFKEANLNLPESKKLDIRDYRKGFHSEHLGRILATMQYIPRSYPDAKW